MKSVHILIFIETRMDRERGEKVFKEMVCIMFNTNNILVYLFLLFGGERTYKYMRGRVGEG